LSVYKNSGILQNHLYRFSKDQNLKSDSVFAKIIPQQLILCSYFDTNTIWFSNSKGLYNFNFSKKFVYNTTYSTILNKISITGDSVIYFGNNIEEIEKSDHNIFDFAYNDIVFEYSSPYFVQEQNTLYSYRLIGESEKWSSWTSETKANFTNLDEGDYLFEVKAKNIYNIQSSVAKFSFTVKPPWYRTSWAFILFGLLAIASIIAIVKINTKRLIAEKVRLEKIVAERTTEIRAKNVELEQQKEEIIAQRDEIEKQRDHVIKQKDEIEKQRDQIAEQQKSIMDSIHYAKRIQSALLPPTDLLLSFLPEHFVLFRPRDIVSGDFYWAYKRDNKIVIAAADCTGHGVPGAFMSMLGMAFLNEIVNKLDEVHAHLILNELRKNVKKSLRQTGKDNEAKDGMDISLCIIDFENMQLEFAGAYNPLYLIRNKDVETFKADRMPIGIYIKEKESFTNNTAQLQKGDCLYIFSDGYVDQFGGPNGGKLMSAKFKDVLLEVHQFDPNDQKQKLNDFIENWIAHTDSKGEKFHQIDDMLVIGIRI
jgi:serine phosphatase RsbU (regulator of sigma subunit)